MPTGTLRIGKTRHEADEGCAARVVNGATVWPQRLAGHVFAAVAILFDIIALSTPGWLFSQMHLNDTHTRVIHSGIAYECQYWVGMLMLILLLFRVQLSPPE